MRHDGAFYYVQWKDSPDDIREAGWYKREELRRDLRNIGAINAYEIEFLNEIKEIIKNTVEDACEVVYIAELQNRLKEEYAEFKFAHVPRHPDYVKYQNLTSLLKTIAGFHVNDSRFGKPNQGRYGMYRHPGRGMAGGTVATDAALEKKRQEEVKKQEELQEAFAMLIDVLKKLGGKTEFQCTPLK